jgi:2-polyprenyl-6-hydroxyphenyl methylase/3-demethylubiquinone-9 3-methyltransferase
MMRLDERSPMGSERFEFGNNWQQFLGRIDEHQILAARESLRDQLGTLNGASFADVGCGSGLFSLAAHQLGAEPVVAFDFDPASVAATRDLLTARASAGAWSVAQGSALDEGYLRSLGQFDVVYSWGVLHHTGDMWQAIENVTKLVKPGGRLWISIYNDQGWKSRVWRRVKRRYNRLPLALRKAYVALVIAPFELGTLGYYLLRGHGRHYLRQWSGGSARGMTRWTDAIDWVGGYPFEVAKPEAIMEFCAGRGFQAAGVNVNRSWGCNEYLFHRPRAG